MSLIDQKNRRIKYKKYENCKMSHYFDFLYCFFLQTEKTNNMYDLIILILDYQFAYQNMYQTNSCNLKALILESIK